MLQSELTKDGIIDHGIMGQLCNIFDGACNQAKASQIRPSTPTKELFTPVEFEWFSKNAYNLSLKYCAEMPPNLLVKLLRCCTDVCLSLHRRQATLTISSSSSCSRKRIRPTMEIFAYDSWFASSSLRAPMSLWRGPKIALNKV